MGEEGGSEQGRAASSWVVDPLDGTINFLFGIPQWCVSVAVRDGEGTLAGAVYDPNRDELFTATRERGGAAGRSVGGCQRAGARGRAAGGRGVRGGRLRDGDGCHRPGV